MTSTSGNGLLDSHELIFRVCFHETDGQRRVHHAYYVHYFERGRVELLRSLGMSYKDLEDDGQMLVVTQMNVTYVAAAEFDDVLKLTTRATEIRKVRIRHEYQIHRGDDLIVQADSTIACVDRNGRPSRLPKPFLQ